MKKQETANYIQDENQSIETDPEITNNKFANKALKKVNVFMAKD